MTMLGEIPMDKAWTMKVRRSLSASECRRLEKQQKRNISRTGSSLELERSRSLTRCSSSLVRYIIGFCVCFKVGLKVLNAGFTGYPTSRAQRRNQVRLFVPFSPLVGYDALPIEAECKVVSVAVRVCVTTHVAGSVFKLLLNGAHVRGELAGEEA